MLRIYPVCLDAVRMVRRHVIAIAEHDRDLARQLERASVSGALNLAEGSGTRGGRRRNTYEIALGEVRETLTCLQIAEAAGFIPPVEPELLDRLDRVVATLVKVVR